MNCDTLLAAAAELDRRSEALTVGIDFALSRELAELAARLRHAARWLRQPASDLCRCHETKPAEAAEKRGESLPLALAPREAAALLGVSERTLARMAKAGELKPMKRGRVIRYARADLEARFLAQKK